MFKIALIIQLIINILNAQNWQIHGAVKSMMKGDLQARFFLQDIKGKQNVYGLGALENLKGEITVIDSRPYISRVSGNEVKLDSTFNHRAALFAYNEIAQWSPDTNITGLNISELENFLASKEKTISKPVAFLFKGKVTSLNWHVINWTTGDTVHTYQKHKASGQHGTIKDEIVTIFGYYSKNLKGILTHHTSTLHLHFVNEMKTIAGHVDNVILGKGILKTSL